MAASINNALNIINDGVREYDIKLRDHEKFDLPQTWYVSRKNTTRSSHRSGFYQRKKIMPGNPRHYVEGLPYVEKDNKIVEKNLRFCLATRCTTNITSSLNNIRPLAGTMLRDPSLNEISQAELDRIKDRWFNIEDIDIIPIDSQY